MTLSNQEILNRVTVHLYRQGKQAKKPMEDGGNFCLYRAPDGSKCAVGCLIPDELYDPSFENNSADFFFYSEPEVGTAMNINIHDKMSLRLLNRLQSIHDNSQNWQNFNNSSYDEFKSSWFGYKIAGIVEEFNLTFPPEELFTNEN